MLCACTGTSTALVKPVNKVLLFGCMPVMLWVTELHAVCFAPAMNTASVYTEYHAYLTTHPAAPIRAAL